MELKKEYERFNGEIFGGELPGTVELKWSRAKRYAGLTSARFSRWTGKCEKCEIRISRFLEYTDHELRETLIHEMIHVKIAFMGRTAWKQRAHGPRFRSEMERINRDYPLYKITISDRQFRTVHPEHRKTQHGITVRTVSGEVWINLYHRRIDEKLFKLLLRRISHFPGFRNAEVRSFSGIYGHTGHFPVRRSEKTLISGLRRPRDPGWFDQLIEETERDCEFRGICR